MGVKAFGLEFRKILENKKFPQLVRCIDFMFVKTNIKLYSKQFLVRKINGNNFGYGSIYNAY